MAFLKLYRKNLEHTYLFLKNLFEENNLHWGVVAKLLCGNELYLREGVMGQRLVEFYAQVFELPNTEITERPMLPIGELAANPQGEVLELDSSLYSQTSYRAIMGRVADLDPKYITSVEGDYEVVGASSDMLVLDLGKNEAKHKVGDIIRLKLRYMGVLQLLNSDYIGKMVA